MDQPTHAIIDLILYLRMPEPTAEFKALHERIAAAKREGLLTDALLQECSDAECVICGLIVCPYEDLLHFHHDGCPSCSFAEPAE